jgi:hypothetical protein
MKLRLEIKVYVWAIVGLWAAGPASAQPGDGSIVAWGRNNFGQCDVPAPNTAFVAVVGGQHRSLGLKADGSIVAWGDNEFGQSTVPAPNTAFVAVAAGGYHSLGLKADGSIVAWGRNDVGQCNVPAPNTAFVAVAGGWHHNLGLKADGSIVAWGWNLYGQCNVPGPNTAFVAVAGGASHSLGLKADGSIVAWGLNNYGQCNVPAPNTAFVAAAGGVYHSLGLKADGSIVAWGYNNHGQCDVPAPNTDFVAVTGGFEHSLGIKGYPRPPGGLDIKPGSCPNPLNRSSRGVLPVAVVGTVDLDVTMIDVSSVRLSRADGVGGPVAPNEGPPGPHSTFEDVATPFEGEACDCHDLSGDGIVDLVLKFRTDAVGDALLLDDLDHGDEIELVVTGSLFGGAEFTTAGDCILIVPPGSSNAAVTSNVAGLFVELSPPDLNVDDSGFADFARLYDPSTVITLSAPPQAEGLVFGAWLVDGVMQNAGQTTIDVTVIEELTARALYLSAKPGPTLGPRLAPTSRQPTSR